jgi:hypothetical protein
MDRKSTDTVAITLRIREDLRRRLERQAKKNNTSLNAEMEARLENSFDQADLGEVAATLQKTESELRKSLKHMAQMYLEAASHSMRVYAETMEKAEKGDPLAIETIKTLDHDTAFQEKRRQARFSTFSATLGGPTLGGRPSDPTSDTGAEEKGRGT